MLVGLWRSPFPGRVQAVLGLARVFFNPSRIAILEHCKIDFLLPQCFGTKGLPKNRRTHCFLVLAIRRTDRGDLSYAGGRHRIWVRDCEPGGRVHTGFAAALSHARTEPDSQRSAIDCRLPITGHILGAPIRTRARKARTLEQTAPVPRKWVTGWIPALLVVLSAQCG